MRVDRKVKAVERVSSYNLKYIVIKIINIRRSPAIKVDMATFATTTSILATLPQQPKILTLLHQSN
jgi:hypothetical protein